MQAPETAHGPCEPPAAYAIGGLRWNKDQPGFAEAMAQAYEQHLRPRCLCRPDAEGQGIEMYVARLLEGYIVKRMPNTGSQHATHCPSYEPPAELSGLGPLLGTAIVENPSTGETTLRLDFPMTKMPGRSTLPAQRIASSSATSQGHKLTLRGLLHYLWDQAELTRWQPGFAGRRTWSTVRRNLLKAAENKLARGQPLLASLYIPEVFSVEQRDAINARRLQQWAHSRPTPGAPQPLMLMIAEVKEIVPARYGFKAVIKHVPDQSFGIDDQLYRRLGRCFERELALWGVAEDLHMLAIATVRMADTGFPNIVELSLMPVTGQWLPVENAFEHHLMQALVSEERAFIRSLRYSMCRGRTLTSAILTDTGDHPHPLNIVSINDRENGAASIPWTCPQAWVWRTYCSDMPPLPVKQHSSPSPGSQNRRPANTRREKRL